MQGLNKAPCATLVAIVLALWPGPTFAVSRVGGGTLSNDFEGFSLTQPPLFPRSRISADDDVLFLGPPRINLQGAGFLAPETLNVFLLRNFFSDLATTDQRANFRDYFQQRGWTSTALRQDCVEGFTYDSGTTYNVALGWGGGKGVVLGGPNTGIVQSAVQSVVASLQLDAGACAWK